MVTFPKHLVQFMYDHFVFDFPLVDWWWFVYLYCECLMILFSLVVFIYFCIFKDISYNIKWMSEWLLFNTKLAIFSYIIATTSYIRWALGTRLTRWNNSPQVDMSLHSDALYWFQANQSFHFLLIDTCLLQKEHIPIV